jgi:hypothetical protein
MTVEAVVEHQFVSQNFLYRIHVPVDARAGQWTGRKGHPQVVSYLHLLLPGFTIRALGPADFPKTAEYEGGFNDGPLVRSI